MSSTSRALLCAGVMTMLTTAILPALGADAALPPNTPSASQVRAGEWWLSEMGIEKAWKVTKGRGVVVGSIDTGVDPTHPDLQGALVPGSNVAAGKGAANGEKPVDGDAHGTTMAGFIVGRGHGGAGMLGVAPEAKVMSVSYDVGVDGPPLGKALRYLVDHGAKVVNMSFGGDTPATSDIAYAESHDVVLVAATGNDPGPAGNPATQFGVVSVTGVLKGLTKIASQASYGPPEIDEGATSTSNFPQGTALAGPFANTDGNNDMVSMTTVKQGSYALTGGTSNASAIVSGIVALIRAAHPTMNAANVVNRLISTASLFKDGKVSKNIGFGVPDAYAAVTSTSIKSVCESPLGSQATKSLGIWPSVQDNSIVYKPKCESGGSSSPASSTSATSASSGTSGGSSAPVSSAPSTAAASSGTSSGGVPAWVIVLIVVAVLAAVALTVLILRGRGKHGGPGGPGGPYGGSGPGGPPGGGGYGPPPGQGGPYGGPPQGGWQPGPPQAGWQPGS